MKEKCNQGFLYIVFFQSSFLFITRPLSFLYLSFSAPTYLFPLFLSSSLLSNTLALLSPFSLYLLLALLPFSLLHVVSVYFLVTFLLVIPSSISPSLFVFLSLFSKRIPFLPSLSFLWLPFFSLSLFPLSSSYCFLKGCPFYPLSLSSLLNFLFLSSALFSLFLNILLSLLSK